MDAALTLCLMFEVTCFWTDFFQGYSFLHAQPRASTPVGPFALSVCLLKRNVTLSEEEEEEEVSRAGTDHRHPSSDQHINIYNLHEERELHSLVSEDLFLHSKRKRE